MNKKIIIYDFDGTLTPYPITKIEVLERIGYEGGMMGSKFTNLVKNKMNLKGIDVYKACYEALLEVLSENDVPKTKESFKLGAENIEYNPGVYDFFNRNKNLNIINYIVSSGSKDFLDGIVIRGFFKEIYATTFKFDENDEAIEVDFLMSDKRKIEVIKNILIDNGIEDNDCRNVVYVGDGLTDLYAMEYIKNNGGKTIFVYQNEDDDSLKAAKAVDVVSYYTKANYCLNSDFSNLFLDIVCE